MSELFQNILIDINANDTYTMVKTNETEISIFTEAEWSQLENILMKFNKKYKVLKFLTDYEYKNISSSFKEALEYLPKNGYSNEIITKLDIKELTGLEFFQILYTEATYNTYVYVNHFRKFCVNNYTELLTYYNTLNEHY